MADIRCSACGGGGRVEPDRGLIGWTVKDMLQWPICDQCKGFGWLSTGSPVTLPSPSPITHKSGVGLTQLEQLADTLAAFMPAEQGDAVDFILDALKSVQEVERERCAKIAEGQISDQDWHDYLGQSANDNLCREIAARIRSGAAMAPPAPPDSAENSLREHKEGA